MAEVIVPEAPGVLAAFGLLAAAIEHHHARTLPGRADGIDLDAVNRCLAELDAAGRARMRRGGRARARRRRSRYSADMRYVGQAYELEVPIAAPLEPGAVVAEAVRGFHEAHERVYGYARADQPVEFVNFRAVHRYPLPRPGLRPPARERGSAATRGSASGARTSRPAGFVATAIYERARLPLGARVPGRPSSSRRTPPPSFRRDTPPSSTLGESSRSGGRR